MEFLISKDRSYLIIEDYVVNLTTNKSCQMNKINISESIDIFKSQSKSYKNDVFQFQSFIRKFGFYLNEAFDFDNSFLLELENKLNSTILTEDVNTILFEQVWDWLKTKTKKGLKYVGDKLSDAGNYLWNKGLPLFFDKLREVLYSPVGIGLDVALGIALPGIGNIPGMILWGALSLWDIKDLIENGYSHGRMITLLLDLLGVVLPLMAKNFQGILLFRGKNIISRSSRNIILKLINLVEKSFTKIMDVLSKAAIWLSKLFGNKINSAVTKYLSSFSSTFKNYLSKLTTYMTQKTGRNITKKTTAVALSKGLQFGLIAVAINKTLLPIIHKIFKKEDITDTEQNQLKTEIQNQNPDLPPIKEFKIREDIPNKVVAEIDKQLYVVNIEKENYLTLTPYSPTQQGIKYNIPTELKTEKDVKKFQDWLDINHSGWHRKYTTLNQNLSRGYGKFGPNTYKGWNLYGNEFLANKNKQNIIPDTDEKELESDLEFFNKTFA